MFIYFYIFLAATVLTCLYLAGKTIYSHMHDNTKMAKWSLALYKYYNKQIPQTVQTVDVVPTEKVNPIEQANQVIKDEEKKLKLLCKQFESSIESQNTIVCTLIAEKDSLINEKVIIEDELPPLIDAKSVNGVNRRKNRLNVIETEIKEIDTKILERRLDITNLTNDKNSTEIEFNNRLETIKQSIEELEREQQITDIETKIASTKQQINQFSTTSSLNSVEESINKELENVRVKKRLAKNNILDNA